MDSKEMKQNKIHKDQCYKQHVKKVAQRIDNYRNLPIPCIPYGNVSFESYKQSLNEVLKYQIQKNEKRIRNNNGHIKQRNSSPPEILQDADIVLK